MSNWLMVLCTWITHIYCWNIPYFRMPSTLPCNQESGVQNISVWALLRQPYNIPAVLLTAPETSPHILTIYWVAGEGIFVPGHLHAWNLTIPLNIKRNCESCTSWSMAKHRSDINNIEGPFQIKPYCDSMILKITGTYHLPQNLWL